MAVEFGAWKGIIAPDATTFQWLSGRTFSPQAGQWKAAVEFWQSLISDEGAHWDRHLELDCNALPRR